MIDMNLLMHIESVFIPELLKRIQSKGYHGYSAYAEPVGNGINVVITFNNRWVQEFTIQNQNGLFFTRVHRTA